MEEKYEKRILNRIGSTLRKKDYKKITVGESKCLRKQQMCLKSSEKEVNKSEKTKQQ